MFKNYLKVVIRNLFKHKTYSLINILGLAVGLTCTLLIQVLGASVQRIIIMLSKEFLKWILIANLIAWPLAYFAMNQVLQDYAFRISISLWVFFFAGFCTLLIALLTIVWQAIKAAYANPVESLRYE